MLPVSGGYTVLIVENHAGVIEIDRRFVVCWLGTTGCK